MGRQKFLCFCLGCGFVGLFFGFVVVVVVFVSFCWGGGGGGVVWVLFWVFRCLFCFWIFAPLMQKLMLLEGWQKLWAGICMCVCVYVCGGGGRLFVCLFPLKAEMGETKRLLPSSWYHSYSYRRFGNADSKIDVPCPEYPELWDVLSGIGQNKIIVLHN